MSGRIRRKDQIVSGGCAQPYADLCTYDTATSPSASASGAGVATACPLRVFRDNAPHVTAADLNVVNQKRLEMDEGDPPAALAGPISCGSSLTRQPIKWVTPKKVSSAAVCPVFRPDIHRKVEGNVGYRTECVGFDGYTYRYFRERTNLIEAEVKMAVPKLLLVGGPQGRRRKQREVIDGNDRAQDI